MAVSSIIGDSLRGVTRGEGIIPGNRAEGDSFAESFRRASAASSPESAAAKNTASVGELTKNAENQLAEFKRTLQQLFAQAGVDTSYEVRLESDGAGGITVGDHPDKAQIEQLLNSNPDLIQKFQELQKTFAKVRGATEEPTPSDSLFSPKFNVTFLDEKATAKFD